MTKSPDPFDLAEQLRTAYAGRPVAMAAAAEIERLRELLRGVGANRYWEGRWRDEAKENERLRAENKRLHNLTIAIIERWRAYCDSVTPSASTED